MKGHIKVIVVLALCVVAFQPVCSISRWFTSSFHDLKMTYKRYANCLGDLPALRDSKYNETEYLVHQTIVFLDQGTYDNEQLANVSAFMDTICNPKAESYAVSTNIFIDSYKNASGKALRCKAIDDALDSIYYVFKRVATNKSEPLDFSYPKFYANPSMRAINRYYNLSDLINTSWITSEFSVDMTCNITEPIKDYIAEKVKNSKPQDRSEIVSDGQTTSKRTSFLGSIMAYLDRMLDSLFGLQRRLYWDGSTIVERTYTSVGSNLATIGAGLGNGLKSARSTIGGLISRSNPTTTNSSALATSPNTTQNLVNPSSSANQQTNLNTKPATVSS